MFGKMIAFLEAHPPVALIGCIGSALAVSAYLVVAQKA
jgi:hypothetical protein